MRPRLFLDLAKRLVIIPHEANWRCAVGRAYYALFLECRDVLHRWGFPSPKSDAHHYVRSRFANTGDPDLRTIGLALEHLVRLRRIADYEMVSPKFKSDIAARQSLDEGEKAIDLLDAVIADPAQAAAAIADIQSRWP